MTRIGGNRSGGRHVIKPLTPRQQKELKDTEKRIQRNVYQDERDRRQHFSNSEHLCPICREMCNGFMAKSGRAALCVSRPSKSPDPVELGYWHRLRPGRVCTCGDLHEAKI